MPNLNQALEKQRKLADAPTLGNLHPDARAQAIARRRLEWLHSSQSSNVNGYEWGIFRVKWEDGKAVEVWQTNGDFSDLDEAMGAAAPVGWQGEVDKHNYVQPVPDHCDRIVWRNRYYHLPLATPTPSVDAEMVKDAENFRWLCEDIENPAERYDRNRLLERMSVVSYSSMRLAIDAIRHAHKDAALAAHKGMSHE